MIPVSIIGTFVFLNVMGRSLNVISLAGFAFAVGMFIDNAIVVLENIFRRHSLGESPMTATVRGTQEVWAPIVAATLTNVAVFAPVIFMQEEAGQLFRDIALAVTGALLLSVVVSMTVVPVATARLFNDADPERIPTTKSAAAIMSEYDERQRRHAERRSPHAPESEPGRRAAASPSPNASIIAPINRMADAFVRLLVVVWRSTAGRSRACRGGWPSCSLMVGASAAAGLADVAEGRVSADRQSQSGVRHHAAAAGLQPRTN